MSKIIDGNIDFIVKNFVDLYLKVYNDDHEALNDLAQILEDVLFERKEELIRKLCEEMSPQMLIAVKLLLEEKYKIRHNYDV